MGKAERKGFASPDEVRKFEKGKVELVKIGGGVVGRLTLEPGLALVHPRETPREDGMVRSAPFSVSGFRSTSCQDGRRL